MTTILRVQQPGSGARAGRLTGARKLIEAQRSAITEDMFLKILAFQETLIASGDEACHTISEAIEENE